MNQTSVTKHLVIVAAGTGGHVMPGLAVAEEMRSRGWEVSWLGTRTGMEKTLVAQRGIWLDVIDFNGLRGRGMLGTLTGVIKLGKAMAQCLRILRQRQPTVVFGTGGYVCVPAGLITALLGKPLVLLNADAAWLMSNRFLRRMADRIALGFPSSPLSEEGVDENATREICTGNPVRVELTRLAAPAERFAHRSGPLRILVLGGSLGAMILNETLPRALALFDEVSRPHVVHQTGERHVDNVRAAYAEHGMNAEVVPFIDDMAAAYASADVVICRAGAITVAELCAAGVPSILVPLRVSTTAHQTHNAQWLAGVGGCLHMPQTQLSAAHLAECLRSLDRTRLLAMAECAWSQAKPHATRDVANLIEEVA